MSITVGEPLSETTARRVQAEFATLCGHLNVLHARMVELTAEALATGAWAGVGLRSPEHWLAWQTGLSPARAKRMVAMARRRDELPVTYAAFANGELSVDQVAVVAAHAGEHVDAEVCELAKNATVSQLVSVLSRFRHADGSKLRQGADPEPERHAWQNSKATRDAAERDERERARVDAAMAPGRLSHGFNDDGRFYLHLELPADEGAVVDQALREAHDRMFHGGQKDVSWADALVDVAHRSLGAVESPDRREQYRTYIHLDTEGAWVNAGPGIPGALLEKLTCDGVVRPLWETEGLAVNVGRKQQAIPPHTRRLVMDRDRTCRYPGCPNSRHLEVHHVLHWARDRGRTDTANLAAHCPFHHDAIHRGHCSVQGDADRPDGLVHRLRNGQIIVGHNQPAPPRTVDPPGPPPGHHYRHPLGESIHEDTVWLASPPPDAGRPVEDRATENRATGDRATEAA